MSIVLLNHILTLEINNPKSINKMQQFISKYKGVTKYNYN